MPIRRQISSRVEQLLNFERLAVLAMAAVCLLAVAEVIDYYPRTFFPRFWDEGIYSSEAAIPDAISAPFTPGRVKYGPMKLGYALPLRGAYLLFGGNGFMYLSTLAWLTSILIVAVGVYRRIGKLEGWFVAAFLAYSSLYGKFIAEAGPTLLAAAMLSLLWATYGWRRIWVTGPILGLLGFVDPKWILPSAMAIALIEGVIESARPWGERVRFLAGVALLSVSVTAVTAIVHPPYWEYLQDYAIRHGRAGGLEASAIFGYYLWIFGAAPAGLAAGAGLIVAPSHISRRLGSARMRSVLHAVVLCGIPLLFYSLFGPLKGLRFFAVPFPLFAVPVAVGVVGFALWIRERLTGFRVVGNRLAAVTLPLLMAGLLVVQSEGPARHLGLSTGISKCMAKVAREYGREGTISSYIWPVVFTRWGGETEKPPFTPWGLLPTDEWLILIPMLDRVTIEGRILTGDDAIDPAAEWRLQRQVLHTVTDSLFSFPAEFYSSDYHLCEQTVLGIGVLRRWREVSRQTDSVATVYRVDREKSQMRFGWK
ncbi:MAG: hypothetical protein AB1752_13345 [Candidatus Zixiibacteriota bacterium]